MSRTGADGTRIGPAVSVTVVHSPACHLCDNAQTTLASLAQSFPLELERVSIDSDRGRELVKRHRAAMSPLVLLDGEFFSSGRLPRGKLANLLRRLRAAEPLAAARIDGRVR